jgi:hypothetical protein
MGELTKPRAGYYFEFCRIIVHVNFAKTWSWAIKREDGDTEAFVFKISLVERKEGGTVLSIVLLPISIFIGLLVTTKPDKE